MMKDLSDPFVEKLKKEVDANLNNDQFGVEELAKNVCMSRSQLHRKLSTATGQSVSQFIREYRLQLGMELLRKGELTAAEVADRVGFGSPTYFNKCFNDYFGFPPGEVKNRKSESHEKPEEIHSSAAIVHPGANSVPAFPKSNLLRIAVAGGLFLMVAWIYLNFFHASDLEPVRTDKSVAILPFKNLSEDRRDIYFSEGVIEAIRTSLSQIDELRVISRTSVEQYRESTRSAQEISRELGVSALMEGSVQRENNKVRIAIRLVDGMTGEQLWATRFDRELKDVFAIQNEIATRVAEELHAQLSAEEKSKLARAETQDPKAYDLVLKAIYEYRTYTNKGAHAAIALLHDAIALDSNYARAYALLGNSYIGLATIWGAELSAVEALQKGKPFIDRALALDPDLDQAHMLLGFYRLYHDWDFAGAEQEYKLAVANNDPDAFAVYIDYLNFVKRHQEAMSWSEKLNRHDPYYPNSRMVLSYIYNDRLEEALEFSESRLKLFNNYSTLDAHGFLMLNLKRYEDAIAYFSRAIAVEGIRYPRMLGWMGAAYARSGDRKKALEIIDELQNRLANNDRGSIAFFIAVIYAALEEREKAFSWLNSAYEAHDMEMPWLLTEPQFYNLHNEPEFQQLLKKVGLK